MTRTNRQEFAKPKLADLNIALAFCLPLTEQFTNCASKHALELCEAIHPPFHSFENFDSVTGDFYQIDLNPFKVT